MIKKIIRVEIDLDQNDAIVIPKNRSTAPVLFFDNKKELAIESIDYSYFTSGDLDKGKHELKVTVGDMVKGIFKYKGFRLF